jgi:hypothetical protein
MNKIDLLPSKKAIEEKKNELFDYFFIKDFLEARNPYHIQPTCAITGEGIVDMIKYLVTATTNRRTVETGISFDDLLIFQDGKLIISKALYLNVDVNSFIPGLMDIINHNVRQLSVDDFKVELKDKRILFFNNQGLTGVAILSKSEDETRAKSILMDIVNSLFMQNFLNLDDSSKKKIYNQIVVPQIIETQAEKDFLNSQKEKKKEK